mmetsp:Transcript_5735/g.15541  ORF Transcript_5735/g.15541 Transcript_5735/m.15541 type:complete len:184 (-) Transcript_5735:117-668(-)
MDVDPEDSKTADATGAADDGKDKKGAAKDEKMDVDVKEGEEKTETTEKKKRKKREPEPTEFRLHNPSRITRAQAGVCSYDLSQRYVPIRPDATPLGVLVLKDTTPGEKEELGTIKAPSLQPEGETAPPEPFEWEPPAEEEEPPAAEPAAVPASADGEGKDGATDDKAAKESGEEETKNEEGEA